MYGPDLDHHGRPLPYPWEETLQPGFPPEPDWHNEPPEDEPQPFIPTAEPLEVDDDERPEKWPPLVELPQSGEPLPYTGLGPILSRLVPAVHETFQVPHDLVVTLALPIITMACHGRWEAKVTQHWKEPICLATLSIMESGSMKSPTLDYLATPLRDAEVAAQLGHKPLVAKSRERRKTLEKEVEKRRAEVAALPDADPNSRQGQTNAGKRAAYEKAVVDLDAHELEHLPVFIIDDTTPEALIMEMAQQDGAMGVLSDEGGLFKSLSGRYTGGMSDLAAVLQGISGGVIKKNRVSYADAIVIQQARLSVCLALQPETVSSLREKPEFRTSGLLARFLPAQPPDMTGYEKSRVDDVPPDVEDGWRKAIHRLVQEALAQRDLARRGQRPLHGKDTRGRKVLELKDDARERVLDYKDELKLRVRPYGDLRPIKDVVKKNAGMAVRIAGALTLLSNPEATDIDDETMAAAIDLARAYLSHAKTALEPLSVGGGHDLTLPLATIVDYLIDLGAKGQLLLGDDGERYVPHKTVAQRFKKRAWASTSAMTKELMEELETRRYVAADMRPPNGKAGGPGRRSAVWVVSPRMFEDGFRAPRLPSSPDDEDDEDDA